MITWYEFGDGTMLDLLEVYFVDRTFDRHFKIKLRTGDIIELHDDQRERFVRAWREARGAVPRMFHSGPLHNNV